MPVLLEAVPVDICHTIGYQHLGYTAQYSHAAQEALDMHTQDTGLHKMDLLRDNSFT
jgi:hypothetical protein